MDFYCCTQFKTSELIVGERIDMSVPSELQDTRNFISCRLRLTNNISSELFSDKQSKNETNVKRLK